MLTKNIGKIWVRECGWKFSYQANNYCTHSISSCEAGLTVWLHHSQGIFFHQGGVLDIMSTWLGTKLQLSYLMFVVQLQTTSTELTTNLCKTYNQHTPGISWPYDQIKRRHLHASARETALVQSQKVLYCSYHWRSSTPAQPSPPALSPHPSWERIQTKS